MLLKTDPAINVEHNKNRCYGNLRLTEGLLKLVLWTDERVTISTEHLKLSHHWYVCCVGISQAFE